MSSDTRHPHCQGRVDVHLSGQVKSNARKVRNCTVSVNWLMKYFIRDVKYKKSNKQMTTNKRQAKKHWFSCMHANSKAEFTLKGVFQKLQFLVN